MSDVRSVVVAGSRFGQFYAAGVAADPRFVLRGILGQQWVGAVLGGLGAAAEQQ
ncbi:hypothetical protein DZ935_030445, partial [Pseudomonas aeruginosa]|nr:hypothetical protein [Pseudomonas aeruginosa]